MSARSTQLAAQLEESVARFERLVESCDDAQRQNVTVAERWSVAVVAQHVALAIRMHVSWLRQVIAGDNLLETTRGELDQANAHFAERFAGVDQAHVLRLLRRNGKAAQQFVAGLSADDLGRTASSAYLGEVVISVDQLVQNILIGHIIEHTRSIEATINPIQTA